MNFYISTIAADAEQMAQQYGLGLEVAEYCTAYNMDQYFDDTHSSVLRKINGISSLTFHAPYNELFPCAIDPEARSLARRRYLQAISLAATYGATKVVIHGGYNPNMYYPCWFTEQSIIFWRDFLNDLPDGPQICLENVLEDEPGLLLDVVKAVSHPRLQLCLDVGHVNTYSKIPVSDWLETWSSYISHFHLHNNHCDLDTHQSLFEGTIPMAELLTRANKLCPDATYALEVIEAEPSVHWLREAKFIS